MTTEQEKEFENWAFHLWMDYCEDCEAFGDNKLSFAQYVAANHEDLKRRFAKQVEFI